MPRAPLHPPVKTPLLHALALGALLVGAATLARADFVSLLAPAPVLNRTVTAAPRGYYANVKDGNGAFEFFSERGALVCRMTAAEAAGRLQFGARSIEGEALAAHAGKTLRVTVQVRGVIGELKDKGVGPLLRVEFQRGKDVVKLQAGPVMREGPRADSLPVVEPSIGIIPPTRLQIITRIPRGAERLAVLCYLADGSGHLEWSDLRVEVTDEALRLTHPVPETL